jgi:hypothetical protein
LIALLTNSTLFQASKHIKTNHTSLTASTYKFLLSKSSLINEPAFSKLFYH